MLDRACERKFDLMQRASHHCSLSGVPDLQPDKHRAGSDHWSERESFGPENLCETFEASNKSTLGLLKNKQASTNAKTLKNQRQSSISLRGDETRETCTAPLKNSPEGNFNSNDPCVSRMATVELKLVSITR